MWQIKLSLTLLFAVAYAVFYLFPNFLPPFPPRMLPLLGIDQTMPFLPWTFLVYLSDYALVFLVIAMLEEAEFFAFSRKMFLTLFLCGAFFILLPTTYPRPAYPTDASPAVAFAMWLVQNGDTPNNCFPSMHVALTSVATWCLRPRGPKVFIPFCLWSVAIFISTLTTKQHYFTDIVGGLGMTAVVMILEKRLAERRWFREAPSRLFRRTV